ncbi:MAG: RluA family pseudouridine synthase [Bacteroidota bacterium]
MATPRFASLILYEDEDYLVVNKPPLLATLTERNSATPYLLQLAQAYHPAAQVAHRLDKTTSGALALAKHPAAYQALCQQFEARTVAKTYHTVLTGHHHFQGHAVQAPLSITRYHRAKVDPRHGKQATTIFTTLQNFAGYTLVHCQPITGRLHQIRIHAAYLQAPIVGDTQYGGQQLYLSTLKRHYHLRQSTKERPLAARVALHAYQLAFTGLQGQAIVVQAPYAADFTTLLKQLTRYASPAPQMQSHPSSTIA